MRRNILVLDFFREIKNSIPRFISILLISLLGVAFFSGIRSAEPDIRYTAQNYMERNNLFDLRIISTIGLDDDDINAIKNIEGVKTVNGGYNVDLIAQNNNANNVLHVYSNLDDLNTLKIDEGCLPSSDNECFLDNNFAKTYNYHLNDNLSLKTKDGSKSNLLKESEFKVVGIGSSPEYISFSRGSSTEGTGEASGFLIVDKSAFNSSAYTKIDISLSDKSIPFTKSYDDCVAKIKDKLNEIEDESLIRRENNIKKEVDEQINKAELELNLQTEKANNELNSAKYEIDKNKSQILNAQKELNSYYEKYKSGILNLNSAKEQLTAAKAEVSKNETLLNELKLNYNEGLNTLSNLQTSLDEVRALIEQYIASHLPVPSYLLEKEQSLNETISNLNESLNYAKDNIDKASINIENAKDEINVNENKINESEIELNAAKNKIDTSQNTINSSLEELKKAEQTYENNKLEVENQLNAAKAQIDENKRKSLDLGTKAWYIQDRNSLPGYTEYGQNADRIKAIGEVFPIIFFLVAILISLTTITRMVDEQRTQIGTLKALGYSGTRIAMKYIFYSFLSTIIGSIIGALIGGKLIPHIIISAYKIMYMNMPDIVTPYNYLYGFAAILTAVFCNMAAAFLACFEKVKKLPANLMRPPVPKSGRKILMERIKFIWNRLSFSQKATFRNLSRYKKRLFMTILGMGGCMALILVGFGIKDSISDVLKLQFENIQTYDITLVYNKDANQNDLTSLNNQVTDNKKIEKYANIFIENTEVSKDSKTNNGVTLIVPQNNNSLDGIITTKDRKTGNNYPLENDSCFITEKLAKLLDIKVGDTISIHTNNKTSNVLVTQIVENYLYHYIYMSSENYKNIFNETPNMNSYDIKLKDNQNSKEIGKQLMENPASLNVTYIDTLHKEVDDMLGSLNNVILILIVSAGLLAFVVLYNLNNISIEERKRELASIKVLGFNDFEVAAYVYRENIYLTIFGILLGIVLGIFLHGYVITTVETSICMFGRNIWFLSYIYSVLITISFSILVNFVMYFKLKNIDMIESLKSFE